MSFRSSKCQAGPKCVKNAILTKQEVPPATWDSYNGSHRPISQSLTVGRTKRGAVLRGGTMSSCLGSVFGHSIFIFKSLFRRRSSRLKILMTVVTLATSGSATGQTVTTTSLTVSSGGNPVKTISAGTMITLTVSVVAGSSAVRQGQVSFCDGTAYCTDIHLLGTAQLSSAGQAQA